MAHLPIPANSRHIDRDIGVAGLLNLFNSSIYVAIQLLSPFDHVIIEIYMEKKMGIPTDGIKPNSSTAPVVKFQFSSVLRMSKGISYYDTEYRIANMPLSSFYFLLIPLVLITTFCSFYLSMRGLRQVIKATWEATPVVYLEYLLSSMQRRC